MPQKIHTHYDNLKVARNAPPDVIKAAYRALSQRYHPDRNSGDAESLRVMTLINQSYEALSDPLLRKRHDEWIELEEEKARLRDLMQQMQQIHRMQQNPQHAQPNTKPAAPKKKTVIGYAIWAVTYWPFYFALVVMVGIVIAKNRQDSKIYSETTTRPIAYNYVESTADTSVSSPSDNSNTDNIREPLESLKPIPIEDIPVTPAYKPKYQRPLLDPNGDPWPILASTLKNSPTLNNSGLSSITIDNSGSDVLVKLFDLKRKTPRPVRWAFIPANSEFTIENIDAGSYDIRYQDLDSGSISKSDSFELEQFDDYSGTQYSIITMTLYKVSNGNMQTYPISESEF